MAGASITTTPPTAARGRVLAGLGLVLVLVLGLVGYKAYGSLEKLREAQVRGSLTLRSDVVPTAQSPERLGFVTRSLNYLDTVWPALLFGVLIGAAVHAFVPPSTLARVFEGGPAQQQVAAAAAGTPLMLCSCCVAPLFSTVYERSGRLAPSLALMLAAPGLNPASLTLCFLLFPWSVAGAKLAMTVTAVLLASRLPLLVLRPLPAPPSEALPGPAPDAAGGVLPLLSTYARACAHLALRTVPWIVLGSAGAMLLVEHVPASVFASGAGVAVVALVALLAVLIVLPTFFEIPLALSLLAVGAPTGAAAAMLFAGPIVNASSLLVVARSTDWKVSAMLAAAIWLIAVVGGLLVG